jgi:hypothetical protein
MKALTISQLVRACQRLRGVTGSSSRFVIIAFFNDNPIKFMSFYRNPSLRILTSFVALLLFAIIVACGNNNTSYGYVSPSATSGYKHRILVSNSYNGNIMIINAANNFLFGRQIATTPQPQYLALSYDGKYTVSYSNVTDRLYYINNSTEQTNGSYISGFGGDVESLYFLSSNNTAITASRNAPVNGAASGVVYLIDLINGVISQTINVPLVRRVVVNPQGTFVLAFADNTNSAYIINTSSYTATAIADPNGVLDRPVNAVFSSDGGTAYILSCGAECGGTQAKVTVFNTSGTTLGNSVNVVGSTAGVIDNSGNLWVAGSPNGVGYLQSLTVNSIGSGTPSAPVGITNGYHNLLTMSDQNHVYVGSQNCSNIASPIGDPVQGCLSVYDPGSGTVTKQQITGNVTGLQSDPYDHEIFAAQGGYFVIYDTTTDQPLPQSQQISISGQAYAILEIS